MCLLIVANVKPERKLLELGHDQNPHGGGIAWRENGKVHWSKGFSGKNAVDEMMKIIEEKDGPYVIHFRWATIGEKSAELCHPFAVNTQAVNYAHGTTTGEILAHNGHWGGYDKELKKIHNRLQEIGVEMKSEKWSDTRAMATVYAHKGLAWLESLKEKVALMSPTGDVKILNKNLWTQVKDGIHCSYNPYNRQTYFDWSGYYNNYSERGGRYNNWTSRNSNIGYQSKYYDKKDSKSCDSSLLPCYEDEYEYEDTMFNYIDKDRQEEINQLVKEYLEGSGIFDVTEEENNVIFLGSTEYKESAD